MNNLILIDTATDVCSVSLVKNGILTDIIESPEGKSHAGSLAIFVEEILKRNHNSISQIDAIAVSSGPGSYTGLRIGVSFAKGICYGANIPLISVPTFQAMSFGLMAQLQIKDPAYLLCPLIDARRMEVYAEFYNSTCISISETEALVIDQESFKEILKKHSVVFFGSGAAKIKETITNTNAIFFDDYLHSSKYMIEPSLIKLNKKQFEDVAYYEPFYLKEFVATQAKNKLF